MKARLNLAKRIRKSGAPKYPEIKFKDTRNIDFKRFTYNEILLHKVALHYLRTGVLLSYDEAINLDTEWDSQVMEMARLVQRETNHE